MNACHHKSTSEDFFLGGGGRGTLFILLDILRPWDLLLHILILFHGQVLSFTQQMRCMSTMWHIKRQSLLLNSLGFRNRNRYLNKNYSEPNTKYESRHVVMVSPMEEGWECPSNCLGGSKKASWTKWHSVWVFKNRFSWHSERGNSDSIHWRFMVLPW